MQYGEGGPSRGGPGGRRKDIVSALMIVGGFLLVLSAAFFTDPRLAILVAGLAFGGVGVALGFDRW